MEQDADSPPTSWFQPPRTTTHRRPPINPVVLLLLLPRLLLLLFFYLPPFTSHIPKTIKPTSLKFTWDLLNVFLVFVAILCGVFAPMNYNLLTTADATNLENDLVPENYEYREKVQIDGEGRRRTWYPDLRLESVWEKDGNWMRFSDDFGGNLKYSLPVNNRLGRSKRGKESIYGSETVSGDICHRPLGSEAEEMPSGVRGSKLEPPNVPDNMLEPPTPAPAPAPTVSVKLRRGRTSRILSRDETVKVSSRIDEVHQVSDIPPPPPGPPPLPPAKSEHRLHMKHNRLEREVRGATTEMETTITSLDDRIKRKRNNKQKTKNIQPLITSIQPPPPSRFHYIFEKEMKDNRMHSAAAA